MPSLEWNDGMSVGVESIDNDHKILLSLITEVAEAIDSDKTKEKIESIFKKLEDYIRLHFSREEKLMQRCNYRHLAAHIQSHRDFVNKIPELKNQLLTTDSMEVAEEINLFLYNWLINHILAEDSGFAQTAHEHGLARDDNREAPSLLRTSIIWLCGKLSLSKRTMLTAVLPITGMLFLSIFILRGSVEEYYNVRTLMDLSKIVHEINALSHSLQAERGLSTGFISSGYRQFFPELIERRKVTDFAANALIKKLNGLSPTLVSSEISLPIRTTQDDLQKLRELRGQVDKQQLSINDMQKFYSGFIVNLLDLPVVMSHLKMSSELAHNFAAFTAILNLKELVGLERALGIMVIENRGITEEEVRYFTQLTGRQSSFLQIFKHSASSEQVASWVQLCGGEVEENVINIENELLAAAKNDQFGDLDRSKWFEVLSFKVDQLKLLSDQLASSINNRVDRIAREFEQRLYFVLIPLFSLFILSILASWLLNHSVIYPVRRITHAMTRLSKGHRDVRFNEKFINDELGEMVAAYELCRRSLLKADVSSAISFRRQELELKHKIREKEHYQELALFDPLTGASNRRNFNNLVYRELERISRYQRPLSVMMLDIDHFKNVNDIYGHANGDIVLKAFYKACVDNVRNTDVVARIGGEEFAVLMPETNQKQAYEFAERIRIAVSKLAIKVDHSVIRVTVSIGVSEWNFEYFKDFNDMLDCADQALYEAKNNGRDRVEVYTRG